VNPYYCPDEDGDGGERAGMKGTKPVGIRAGGREMVHEVWLAHTQEPTHHRPGPAGLLRVPGGTPADHYLRRHRPAPGWPLHQRQPPGGA